MISNNVPTTKSNRKFLPLNIYFLIDKAYCIDIDILENSFVSYITIFHYETACTFYRPDNEQIYSLVFVPQHVATLFVPGS